MKFINIGSIFAAIIFGTLVADTFLPQITLSQNEIGGAFVLFIVAVFISVLLEAWYDEHDDWDRM